MLTQSGAIATSFVLQNANEMMMMQWQISVRNHKRTK